MVKVKYMDYSLQQLPESSSNNSHGHPAIILLRQPTLLLDDCYDASADFCFTAFSTNLQHPYVSFC